MSQHGAFGAVSAELGKIIQAVLINLLLLQLSHCLIFNSSFNVQQFLGEGKSHPQGCRGILSWGHGACRTLPVLLLLFLLQGEQLHPVLKR